jgi:NADH pyrophosphatase NudC (nudix superfamily)
LAAAHREVHEELGVKAEQLEFVAAYHSRAEGKRDAIHMFAGRCTETIQPDNFEIAEARHFELDALPELLSPATARRVAEYRGEAPITGVW